MSNDPKGFAFSILTPAATTPCTCLYFQAGVLAPPCNPLGFGLTNGLAALFE